MIKKTFYLNGNPALFRRFHTSDGTRDAGTRTASDRSKGSIRKLSNGLTYYIRHNDQPKDRADFYIAQNVGSILEEDNQRGLAHFLEHMAFDGSRNFPE